MTQARSNHWDNWKGLAIIAVVMVHVSGATERFPAGSFNNEFGVVLRQFINFPVAVFLFISGYFAQSSRHGSPADDPLGFQRRRLPRILVPYLAWTLVYLAARQFQGGQGVAEVVQGVAFGTAMGVGYFVIVLLQLTLLTPLLDRLGRGAGVALMAASGVLSAAFIYYFQLARPQSILAAFPYYALPFFVWMPFYLLGFVLAKYPPRAPRAALWWLLYLAALAASVVEGLHWQQAGLRALATSQLKASTVAASLALCMLVYLGRNQRGLMAGDGVLAWLGRHSYPIYLGHMLVLVAAGKALGRISPLFQMQPLYLLTCTTVVLLVCAGIVTAAKKALPHWLGVRVLGA